MPYNIGETADSIYRMTNSTAPGSTALLGHPNVVRKTGAEAMYREFINWQAFKGIADADSVELKDHLGASVQGTRDGKIDNIDFMRNAPVETWTITFTGAGAPGTTASGYDVSGSSTAAVASGTLDDPYNSTNGTAGPHVAPDPPLPALAPSIQFTITAGTAGVSTEWKVDDTLVFDCLGPGGGGSAPMTHADSWVLDSYNPNITQYRLGGGEGTADEPTGMASATAFDGQACTWHGTVNGTGSVPCGLCLYTNGTDTFNWNVVGQTGFDAVADLFSQPGSNMQVGPSSADNESTLPLYGFDMRYWFVGNSRRFIVVANVNGRYFSLYQGLILPYASPEEYPYPAMHHGMFSDGKSSHTITTPPMANWAWNVNTTLQSGVLRGPDAVWRKISDGKQPESVTVWPSMGGSDTHTAGGAPHLSVSENYVVTPGTPADQQLLPHVLTYTAAGDAKTSPITGVTFPYGAMEGSFSVMGLDITAETPITIGGVDYIPFPQPNTSEPGRWYAIEMA